MIAIDSKQKKVGFRVGGSCRNLAYAAQGSFSPSPFRAAIRYNIEKDIAAFIKKEFDKKYNPTWHCIVGRNFGSYVTHETKHFIYFYLGQVAILLFKSG